MQLVPQTSGLIWHKNVKDHFLCSHSYVITWLWHLLHLENVLWLFGSCSLGSLKADTSTSVQFLCWKCTWGALHCSRTGTFHWEMKEWCGHIIWCVSALKQRIALVTAGRSKKWPFKHQFFLYLKAEVLCVMGLPETSLVKHCKNYLTTFKWHWGSKQTKTF